MWSLSENAASMFAIVSACFAVACLVEVHTRFKENEKYKGKRDYVDLKLQPPLMLALIGGLAFLVTLAKLAR
jgi:hypothetical protein